MKKRQLALLLVASLFISLITNVFAAITDTASPYEGDYLLAINTSTEPTLRYSGNLSIDALGTDNMQFAIGETDVKPSNPNVIDVQEENGLKMEQIDPRPMLESRKKSNSINMNQNSMTQYSESYSIQYSVGDVRTFSTADFRYNPPLTVYKTFTLKYSGTECNIWIESDSSVYLSSTNINNLGSEFDNNIYTKMTESFGTGHDKDGDGKTAIMLYDIQDGWNGTTIPGYIGGFFSPDEIEGYENNMDVIHIDTYPAMGTNKSYPSITKSKSIITHEYQHLINFSYSYTHSLAQMPLWLNEGLSMAAEHMLYGSLTNRISYFNSSTSISDGHSLFYWDSDGDVLSNYALSYLFLQYLRVQTKIYITGGTGTYKSFIQSSNRTPTVVQDIMRPYFPSITLDDIQINFRMATILKESVGAQGFMGESDFEDISPMLYTSSGISLRGGGAIIKAISTPVTPTGYGSNIKFVGFKWNKVAKPVANVESGVVVTGTQVALSSATNGATIRYTTDGSTPTPSYGTVYYSPITITENVTIKVISYKSRMSTSDDATFTYKAKVANPYANPSNGTVESGAHVILSCATSGAAIRYTIDGSTPTSVSGILYSTPIILTANTIIKTIACKNGIIDSDIETYSYSVKTTKPTSSILSGTVVSGTQIMLSCTISGASIRYTTDGSTPNSTFGKVYTTPITVVKDTTIRAIAYKSGMNDSDVVSFPYKVLSNDIVWKKNFGSRDYDYYDSIAVAEDGYVAVGFSGENSFNNGDWASVTGKGSFDAIIAKYDMNGNILWKKNYGGKDHDEYNSIAVTPDGYVAVGTSSSQSFNNGDWEDVSGKGNIDAIIVKYDINGDVLWKKNFGGLGYDYYNSIAVTTDGYVAVGTSSSQSFNNGDWAGVTSKGNIDGIVVKYDLNGNLLWVKNFGGLWNTKYYSVATSINGYVAVGTSSSESFNNGDWEDVSGKGNSDAIIVKYDINGDVLWKKNFGGLGDDFNYSIATSPDGYVAAGFASSFSFNNGDWLGVTGMGDSDATIVKYDLNGNLLWKKNFGGKDRDHYISIANAVDGYIAVGSSASLSFNNGDWTGVINKGNNDAIIAKYDLNGNLLWKKNFGALGYDSYNCVATFVNGYAAVGASPSFKNGDWIDVDGKGLEDATFVKYFDADTLVSRNIYNISYSIYSNTTQLNLFPQLAGIYPFKAQFMNTTDKIIDCLFVMTIKSNNKLLKTYIIPKTVAIDGVVDISQDLDLPSSTTHPNLEIKLMALENLSSLNPLAVPITIGR